MLSILFTIVMSAYKKSGRLDGGEGAWRIYRYASEMISRILIIFTQKDQKPRDVLVRVEELTP